MLNMQLIDLLCDVSVILNDSPTCYDDATVEWFDGEVVVDISCREVQVVDMQYFDRVTTLALEGAAKTAEFDLVEMCYEDEIQ